ncbi:DUF305 domain-containing protein [Paraburkholderia sp. SARCC-3016]|uniref:CopM family metallochaperone n=1 Tax=Paraburkholderia sp. SARCC-3016 TaxID=3058611 RepID=UPI002808BD4F|nr:DUF305 domain-containing protein [Paraburkholderia sp. SARCC-3016]MDQ7981281.1 DUF305 domain-containing protein [Paraburkholderia sp. SARCC-3016]
MHKRVLVRAFGICTAFAIGAASAAANAQQAASMPGMHMNMAGSSADSSPATQAFQQADQKMMQHMSAPPYTGDADKDFVTHMLPHHQGAVDMAEVELKYGKDPQMKKLASNIVKTQKEEIAIMKRWLAKHEAK